MFTAYTYHELLGIEKQLKKEIDRRRGEAAMLPLSQEEIDRLRVGGPKGPIINSVVGRTGKDWWSTAKIVETWECLLDE